MSPHSKHIRGRNSVRSTVFSQPSLLPTLNRPVRHSTPKQRSLIRNSRTSTFADAKKPHPVFARIPSSGLVVSTIALTFFVFGIFVSSTISALLVSPRARDIPLSMPHDQPKFASTFSAFYPISNITPPTLTHSIPSFHQMNNKTPNSTKETSDSHTSNRLGITSHRHSILRAHRLKERAPQKNLPVNLSSAHFFHEPLQAVKPLSETEKSTVFANSPIHNQLLSEPPNSSSVLAAKPPPYDPMKGRVSWNRSWPISAELDETHLFPLASALKFHNRTMLNYFHMHKTGGVTLKSEVMGVVNNPVNKANAIRRGYGLRYIETCYEVPSDASDDSIEGTWRCDFDNVRKMTDNELASIDIIMGHQYWNEGTEGFFSKYREIRPFSIFRHPLPRKLSFFYHFFVRNVGRDEAKVSKDEVIKFILGEEMPDDPSTRDAGPNYYASRMVSDGVSGFNGHRYEMTERQSDETILNVVSKLENKYALVGLQVQHEASQCMLEKLMQVFAHARGIDDLVGTPKLSFHTAKLNSGGYPWTSRKIWTAMTAEQRQKYKKVERVDLAIYERAVRRFKEDVKLYSCEDKVVEEAFLEDILE